MKSKKRIVLCFGAVVTLMLLSGCGGSTQAKSIYVQSGQIPKTEIPHGGKGGTGSSSQSTIPLAQQNPETALFTALSVFQSCLKNQGTKFIGIPSKTTPNAPVDNPSYIKALQTCASESNILQAFKDAQTAQKNLTLAQIKHSNKQYLAWRKCMIGRGWKIATPVPNSKGLLFSFGATTASQIVPPPGQSLLGSNDIVQCAQTAQKQVTGV